MDIKNAKRWGAAGIEPLIVAAVGFIVALGLRFSLHSLLEDHLSMLFFAINSVIMAFLYGFWVSIGSMLLSIPFALYFFTAPYGTFSELNDRDVFILIVHVSLVISTAILLEWTRREQYKAILIARVAESRYRLLIETDEDRRNALKAKLS